MANTHFSGPVHSANGFVVGDETIVDADGKLLPDQAVIPEARTATAAPGGTTGVISESSTFVVVTSSSADNVITLPAPVPGKRILIINGATGYELRSSDPATVGINGGTGANAESAIAASMILELICVSATNWIGSSYTAAGVKGVVQVAA